MSTGKAWEGKTVLVRAGLNLPLKADGSIADDFRLQRVLPTLATLSQDGAKVIVISHLGRQASETLAPVAQSLSRYLDLTFKADFFADSFTQNITALREEVSSSSPGQVWLLDNLRQHPGEKANSLDLAQELAQGVDVYVNEAFSVSHRLHMSLQALPALCPQAIAGYACIEEVAQLGLALSPPPRSLAIISGNKSETKLPLIEKFLQTYHTVMVGGVLANTLYHLQGHNIGRSVYEDELDESSITKLLALAEHPRLSLPSLVVCGQGGGEREVKDISQVRDEDYIYDLAPEGLDDLAPLIRESNLVVWNGPLGYYEGGYTEGTARLLELITTTNTQSLIGGGNTVDAVRDLGYEDQVSFLSTGGGAMIDFLTTGSLPALEALHLG